MSEKITTQEAIVITTNIFKALKKGYMLAKPNLWKWVQTGLNFLVVAIPAITFVYPPAAGVLTKENLLMVESGLGVVLSYFGFATTGKVGLFK